MSRPPSPDRDTPHQAEVYALRVAQEAAAHVPAYARFLRQHGYDARRLRSFADFCALPVMDKASYLARYPLAERCRQGDVTRAHIVTLSSGTSGPATFWPRYPEQDSQLWNGLRTMFQEHFRIRERWTLVVVGAAMGPWGFSTSATQATQRIFSERGIRGTVVTPGIDREEALRFVEQLHTHYDQTILVSYPTLVVPLLEAGQARGISWPELNTGVWTSGEGTTEPQRERILQYLGKDPDRLEGLVNGFGATEVAGLIGYETHLCLLIRRLCEQAPALAEALFGSRVVPSLNQYNPLSYFLQSENGEVLLTMRGAVPLIRYNTHDRGGLLGFDEMGLRCRAAGYDLREELRARSLGHEYFRPLPFLYVHGRNDGVTVHSVCVYLEEVAHALEQTILRPTNTGNFELSAIPDPEGTVTLHVAVELCEGITANDALRRFYEDQVLVGLVEISPRFRATYEVSRERTALEVEFLPYGTLQHRGPKHQRAVLPHERRGRPDASPANTVSES
jgi:phenylacetate-CoA ligase